MPEQRTLQTVNMHFTYAKNHKADIPHQRRDTLKDVLVEVRVARILRNDAQDCDQALQDPLVSRGECRASRDNDTHRTFVNEEDEVAPMDQERSVERVHFIR